MPTPRAHAELIKQWADDDSLEIEYRSPGAESWSVATAPMWDPHTQYRIKQTKPSIDWSQVSPEYKWLARDSSSLCGYLYKNKPHKDCGAWDSSGGCSKAGVFASYRPGTCDWEESLVERPEGV